MKYCAVSFGFFLLISLSESCSPKRKEETEKLPRIEKMVPGKYLAVTDPGLTFRSDTVYRNGELFCGFLYETGGEGLDTSFVGGYFNGMEEGRHAKWYPDGMIKEERFYINGKKEGLHRGWWPDGKPKFRFTCYNGELEGLCEEWSAGGILIKQFNYRNGYEEGAQKLWWDNGSTRANYVVKNGRQYGLIGRKLCSNPYDSAFAKK